MDAESKPSFHRLQQRAHLSRHDLIQRATVQLPAYLMCFDLLAVEGFDLRDRPLVERKALLQRLLPKSGPLRYSDHFAEHGEAMYAQVEKMGLEGIMAKRASSKYVGKRSDDWLKIKRFHSDNFFVVGYTSNRRAVHVARKDGDRFLYTGRVGSGLTDEKMAELLEWLADTEVEECPAEGYDPSDTGWGRKKDYIHVWVRPRLVIEVKYHELTPDGGHLRHPSFLRMRLDESFPGETPEKTTKRDVPYTNRDKVFWSDEGYTKGDLIDYYLAVARWLLPLVEDRPLVMTRYPDGPDGKSFFQKDTPSYLPDWVRRQRIFSELSQREIGYIVADCPETLGYIANMASIPIHVWSSRTTDLSHPDWCVIDLDPKTAPFADVIEIALGIRRLCDEIGIASFPKTSGASGMHVLLPLGGLLTYQQCRDLAMLVGRAICQELPAIATIERGLNRRDGKVYLDTLQNGHGRLIVSPYCVLPRPGATVSTPLEWDEVGPDLDPGAFTIRTVPARLAALDREPLAPILDIKPDLMNVLDRLSARFTG